LDAEVRVVEKDRLDEQGPLLVPCPSHEVVSQMLWFYAGTTVALKGGTVPAETLGTVPSETETRLYKEIALEGPTPVEVLQYSGCSECSQDCGGGKFMSHAHFMECQLVVNWIRLQWPVKQLEEARGLVGVQVVVDVRPAIWFP